MQIDLVRTHQNWTSIINLFFNSFVSIIYKPKHGYIVFYTDKILWHFKLRYNYFHKISTCTSSCIYYTAGMHNYMKIDHLKLIACSSNSHY